jgi:hypothetical protein
VHSSSEKVHTDPYVVRNDDVIGLAGVSEQEFTAIRDRELLEIERSETVPAPRLPGGWPS